MRELEYPFSSEKILRRKNRIRRELISEIQKEDARLIKIKIASLGGSTTNDIREILDLFLLDAGIEAEFYECEYGKYWESVMFKNEELQKFNPDLIYIHTSIRNILRFPDLQDDIEEINDKLKRVYSHFEELWDCIDKEYQCPIIQNNFELPFYRLLGNREANDPHGKVWFVNQLNQMFYEYANKASGFYINDINFLSSNYGLSKWSDPYYWYMFKYCLAISAIPELAYNLSNIIKAIYGKNKKVLMLDLDNTLWGGIIGDEGPENIEIGEETPQAQAYREFQSYIKKHKDLGVILTINSKNDKEKALAGLARPDSILHEEDFTVIKSNWNPKDDNALAIAEKLNVGQESLVFVDDNPAERELVRNTLKGVGVPELDVAEHYIQTLDQAGFFETLSLSQEDLCRNSMYKANEEREKQKDSFADYGKYLDSLEMHAEIGKFLDIYISRIAQLTNKTNQFNLTTKRSTQAELKRISQDPSFITLYGRLRDKYGDNGIVSVVYGHIDKKDSCLFHIDLWLMSCRVFKRDMELAMMDELVTYCKSSGITKIRGYYYPTKKNRIVQDFYEKMGFRRLLSKQEDSAWEIDIAGEYENKNTHIQVETVREKERPLCQEKLH